MNGWVKGALAAGGGALGVEALRRIVFSGPRPRYEPWERAPYGDFPNKVLIRDGASFRRAEVESVDAERQRVIADGREFPYDHLIVALGAELAYFGIPGVQEHAINIKGIAASEEIRNRVIERYEESTLSCGEVPDSHPSFVVIGGGATGVEIAAELHAWCTTSWRPTTPT